VTLLDDAYAMVRVPSVSRNESALAALLATQLRTAKHLDVERIGDNVVARTTGNHRRRIIVAGHIDTVPGDAAQARVEGDRLVGVGAADMKGSVAIMVRQALNPVARPTELTWVFYAREEIARAESGLLELAELRPDLLVGDVAIVAEPTGGAVEAGCQGTLRVVVTVVGARAHTSRPWTGRNAIHRLARVIEQVAAYEPRVVTVDGVTFTEQMQVVSVEGGIAPNVVPDRASCVLNHRVAPDRSLAEATDAVRELLGDVLGEGDELVVGDWAPAAPPSLGNEMLQRLVRATGVPARAKVGWTDVATFYERGVPSANFGAGDPLLAHRSDEFVTASELEAFDAALAGFLAAD
jgi:succinyl-diaminopimelate desuccinylase